MMMTTITSPIAAAIPKFPYRKATAGDRLCLISPCGGGYGDPLARDQDAIRADIVDGYVSRESARALYNHRERT